MEVALPRPPPRCSHVNDVTDVTDKFKIPVGGCDGFQGEKSASKGVTCNGSVTDIPRGKIPRIYISRPVGHTQHTTNGSIADAPESACPTPARLTSTNRPVQNVRWLCEACGAEIQSGRIDARFCSGRCRQRAHRHASNSLVTPVADALPNSSGRSPSSASCSAKRARAAGGGRPMIAAEARFADIVNQEE